MLTIGDKIKYFRKQRGITQAQLAELTGWQPLSQQIERIAQALWVSSGAFSSVHTDGIHLDKGGSSGPADAVAQIQPSVHPGAKGG